MNFENDLSRKVKCQKWANIMATSIKVCDYTWITVAFTVYAYSIATTLWFSGTELVTDIIQNVRHVVCRTSTLNVFNIVLCYVVWLLNIKHTRLAEKTRHGRCWNVHVIENLKYINITKFTSQVYLIVSTGIASDLLHQQTRRGVLLCRREENIIVVVCTYW